MEENLCLLSDETPDRGATVEGFHISDETGRVYVLGLREMCNKSSLTTLDTFKEILNDISNTSERDPSATECGKQIVSKISSTMSDQAATQKCFNDLLQDYKEEILPDVISSWEDMSATEQSSCSTINNFFCGLHLLINFAETANQVLKKYESACDNLTSGNKKSKPGESGTVNFIRIACKALGKRGDAKSGAHTLFKDYIYSRLGETLFLEPFHGNRFNILFVNAGSIYFYREEIQDFLENSVKERNRLLQAVLDAVKVEEYVAAAKALGLIEKLVTSPLWRIIESKCHILDMNNHYSNLLDFFEAAAKDAIPFINGKHTPFPSYVVVSHPSESENPTEESIYTSDSTRRNARLRREDAVWVNLLTDSPYDDKAVGILQMIFAAWAIYLKRAVKSHLPGGDFSSPSEELRQRSTSVPKHNKFSEAVFGILHNLTTMRPNASVLANRTLDWINSKCEDERDNLVKKARKLQKKMQQRFLPRRNVIKRKRQEALTKQRQEIQKQSDRALQEKERLTNEIVYHGLWQTQEEVLNNAKSYKNKKEWQRAFQAQFKFRKIVLQQEYEDKSIFNLSKDKKDLSLQQLTANLIKLIGSTFTSQSEEQVVKRGNPLLVGKTVLHTFEEDGERVAYQGKVIDTVHGFPESYNIKYEDDDVIYTYKLQEDYEKGDLKLVVGQTASTHADPSLTQEPPSFPRASEI